MYFEIKRKKIVVKKLKKDLNITFQKTNEDTYLQYIQINK